MDILDKIKTTKSRLGKSEMTSGDKFKVKISYNGKSCYMVFNDNFENKSDKKDFIYSLWLDADAWINSKNLADFMSEFGYDDKKQASKIYNACEKQAQKFNKLFTQKEQNEIRELLADY